MSLQGVWDVQPVMVVTSNGGTYATSLGKVFVEHRARRAFLPDYGQAGLVTQ